MNLISTELIYLAISNQSSYISTGIRIEMEAEKNYNDSVVHFNALNNLSDNDKMLTNIDAMKNKFRLLTENGSIKENDLTYIQLYDTIKQAMDIQEKQNKSLDNTAHFYSIYRNFFDICKRVR